MPVAPQHDPMNPGRDAPAEPIAAPAPRPDLDMTPPDRGTAPPEVGETPTAIRPPAAPPPPEPKRVVGPTALGRAFAERSKARNRGESVPALRSTIDPPRGSRSPLAPAAGASSQNAGDGRHPTEPAPPDSATTNPVTTDDDQPSTSILALAGQILALVLILAVVYVGLTAWQVWGTAEKATRASEQVGPADAVVVLGAAQYDGEPSPVLEGRLNQALEIFESGRVDFIVPTGSNQPGDRFTEGFAGYTYLRDRGVPEESILVNVDGGNSWEQLTSTAAIMAEADLDTAILVSDPYHAYRLEQIADEVGIDARVEATDLDLTISDLTRETAAVSVGRIIGYRRSSNVTN